MQFLVQFFSTQKCFNRNKTHFTTKQRKSYSLHITHMSDVENCRFLHMHRNLKFLHMTDFFSTYPIGDVGDKYEV